ncbi:MAG: ribonuclease P protein component [Candidatus Komeilibacteria bacterium]
MRRNSLSKEKEIIRALKGRPFFSKYLTLKAVKNNENKEYRYTVIVSKKNLKLAVDRNKFKRRARSIVAKHAKNIGKQWDFVIIAKKGVENADFSSIQDQITAGLKELKILKND